MDIHELYQQVRNHPDYVFGTIFVKEDFPGEKVPENFPANRGEDHLAEHGNWYISEHTQPDDAEDDDNWPIKDN